MQRKKSMRASARSYVKNLVCLFLLRELTSGLFFSVQRQTRRWECSTGIMVFSRIESSRFVEYIFEGIILRRALESAKTRCSTYLPERVTLSSSDFSSPRLC